MQSKRGNIRYTRYTRVVLTLVNRVICKVQQSVTELVFQEPWVPREHILRSSTAPHNGIIISPRIASLLGSALLGSALLRSARLGQEPSQTKSLLKALPRQEQPAKIIRLKKYAAYRKYTAAAPGSNLWPRSITLRVIYFQQPFLLYSPIIFGKISNSI